MLRGNIRSNAFHQTMIGLEYALDGQGEPDLFSRACVDYFKTSDPRQFGYQFTQLFEPGVLHEVALLEGAPAGKVETFDYRPTATIRELRDRLAGRHALSAVERIHLASVLVSISRFDAGERALPETGATARERYELAWVQFLICNRRDDGVGSAEAFSRLREAVEEGGIPPGRIVDACTQGIVWYLKRREIDEGQFRWCVSTGEELVGRCGTLGSGTVSSWYRGLAMLPAAQRDPGTTRKYMNRAYDHAQRVAGDPGDFGALNSLKTYYESSIKEFLYVSPDPEAAERAGRELIALDERWSISYAEVAQIHVRFGDPERAAQYYEKAVDVGPPYVGHHLVSAAECRAKLGDVDAALQHYRTVNDIALVPNEQICRAALGVAEAAGHSSCDYFNDALQQVAARTGA